MSSKRWGRFLIEGVDGVYSIASEERKEEVIDERCTICFAVHRDAIDAYAYCKSS